MVVESMPSNARLTSTRWSIIAAHDGALRGGGVAGASPVVELTGIGSVFAGLAGLIALKAPEMNFSVLFGSRII